MRTRSIPKGALVIVLILLVSVSTARFGYALLEEGRDLALVDYTFRMSLRSGYENTITGGEKTRMHTPIDFALLDRALRELEDERDSQKRKNNLDEVPPQTLPERLIGYLAPTERVVVGAARVFSGSDRHRAFRQVQVDFLRSRRPPIGGERRIPGEDIPSQFFSHPALRELVVRTCLEYIKEDTWNTSLDARCLNYIGIVATDRTRDRRIIADPEESLKEAIAAFQEAVHLDPENPYLAENLEKLLEYVAALQFAEQEATGTGDGQGDEPSDESDEGVSDGGDEPGGGEPGQGNY